MIKANARGHEDDGGATPLADRVDEDRSTVFDCEQLGPVRLRACIEGFTDAHAARSVRSGDPDDIEGEEPRPGMNCCYQCRQGAANRAFHVYGLPRYRQTVTDIMEVSKRAQSGETRKASRRLEAAVLRSLENQGGD